MNEKELKAKMLEKLEQGFNDKEKDKIAHPTAESKERTSFVRKEILMGAMALRSVLRFDMADLAVGTMEVAAEYAVINKWDKADFLKFMEEQYDFIEAEMAGVDPEELVEKSIKVFDELMGGQRRSTVISDESDPLEGFDTKGINSAVVVPKGWNRGDN